MTIPIRIQNLQTQFQKLHHKKIPLVEIQRIYSAVSKHQYADAHETELYQNSKLDYCILLNLIQRHQHCMSEESVAS